MVPVVSENWTGNDTIIQDSLGHDQTGTHVDGNNSADIAWGIPRKSLLPFLYAFKLLPLYRATY